MTAIKITGVRLTRKIILGRHRCRLNPQGREDRGSGEEQRRVREDDRGREVRQDETVRRASKFSGKDWFSEVSFAFVIFVFD